MQIQKILANYLKASLPSVESDIRKPTTQGSRVAAAEVSISKTAWDAYQNAKELAWQFPVDKIESDPVYAESFVRDYVSFPDLQPVKLVVGEKVGEDQYKMTEEDIHYLSGEQYKKDQEYFLSMSQTVQQKRQSIFQEMKARGADGKEIFYALMDYNNALPVRYRDMAGLEKLPSAAESSTTKIKTMAKSAQYVE